MSPYINKYTCHGIFALGRNIADALSGMLYDLEIVEGKDQP